MTTDKRGSLVVIVGPTCSGKTDASIALAQRLAAPILSADSRQVFRGMAIGTAQPTTEQLAAAEHHFIADRDISDDYNAGRFEAEALGLLASIFRDREYAIAVGGSGLYVDALCHGLDDLPKAEPTLRHTLEERLRQEGIASLAEELHRLDPVYHASADLHNPARVLRAVEVCLQTGKPYSALRSGHRADRPFRIIKIGIEMPREELYDRINRRVDAMMDAGLESEARRLYSMRNCNALMTVGYREMFAFFDGDISREKAVELIKRNTRHYAKRQITWFSKNKDIKWFHNDEINFMENFIKKFAE